ncbi:hypothetical protein [Novosphingobium sp. M1R2S20]|uniref:Uncharacterized protein n=1 Tax=Novosphingobium rhizovicinum TaxID=3228928 RepID=A0ABV3R9J8_9SPHN
MIDIFALSVAHGLLVLAALRLFGRGELDQEGKETRPFGARRRRPAEGEKGEHSC